MDQVGMRTGGNRNRGRAESKPNGCFRGARSGAMGGLWHWRLLAFAGKGLAANRQGLALRQYPSQIPRGNTPSCRANPVFLGGGSLKNLFSFCFVFLFFFFFLFVFSIT